jgi:dolichol-phosphate mannosyltransferase
MRKLVIIPTYNEKQNIEPVIRQILALKIPQLDILVIDDNSPDDTAKVVDELKKTLPGIFLIKRAGKLGLGTAYITGFKWAIRHEYDAMVEMDADLSHDPKALNNLFVQAEKHDFVIGSRYVKGGGVVNWPFKRRLLSKLGSLYARAILGVKIHDFTGGYNLWKKEILKRIGLNDIKSEGYSFQIEMKYRAVKAGFKFTEVPIIFNDRVNGKSKMSARIFKEAIWRVWWLRGKFLLEAIKNWSLKDKLINSGVLLFFILLTIWRFHNAWVFNPLWGYDGGGHLAYISSLAKNNAFPNIVDNYIAWHEPLYYLLYAAFLKVFWLFVSPDNLKAGFHFLSVLQATLSLMVSFLVYKLSYQLSKSKFIALISLIWFSLLPAFTQASTFITNELLSCLFCFWILIYSLKNFSQSQNLRIKQFFWLGWLFGLALLTKITALIVIIAIIAYFIWRAFAEKKFLWFKGSILTVVIALIVFAPWLVYRSTKVLDSFSINNTDFLAPKALVVDDRIDYFTGIDKNIFTQPNFKSGKFSFWSMLYADTFYDYYGSMENEDFINQAPKEVLVNVSDGEEASYISKKSFNRNKILVYLGLPLTLFLFFGMMYNGVVFFKNRKLSSYLLGVLPPAFLLAQIYYAYRYPYFDFGVVKAIFILPGYLFLMIGSLRFFKKIKPLLVVYLICLLGYLIVLWPTIWLDKYNF